jgi:DNA-binding XRE family transcriptional regulator
MLKTTIELPAEAQAKLAAIRAKSLTDRHLEGPPFPGTKGEGIRFYLSLRAMIAKLKAARETNGLTLAEVSKRSGISEETLCRLETGAAMNPTWKTLGDYAHAVGMSLMISAEASAN